MWLGGRWIDAKQLGAGQIMVLSMMLRSLPWSDAQFAANLGRLGDLFDSLLHPADYWWLEKEIMAERVLISDVIGAWVASDPAAAMAATEKETPKRPGRSRRAA